MKKIKLFVIDENSNFSFSLNLNKAYIFIILSLFLFTFIFSLWGFYRFVKPHQNQKIINHSKNIRFNTLDLISNLIDSSKIDSSLLTKYQLNNHEYNMANIHKPISGIVTQGISEDINIHHPGIDIAATLNAKVESADEGMVVFSGFYEDYGNTIIISHPNNFYTLYSHLNKAIVQPRDYVERGQLIGYVGETGKSNGPHLHFEIWKNHIIIDPRELINEYKVKDVSIKENE